MYEQTAPQRVLNQLYITAERGKLGLAPSINDSVIHIGARATSESVPYSQYAAHEWGFTGDGYTIAVLDTGINRDHQTFGVRIRDEACFSSNRTLYPARYSLCEDGSDQQIGPGSAAEGHGTACGIEMINRGCGHGTHVASIAAGRMLDSGYDQFTRQGVASYATVLPVGVFHRREASAVCDGDPPCVRSYAPDLADGLGHVFMLAGGPDPVTAVNLSLGHGEYSGQCSGIQDAVEQAIAQLVSAGIAVVAASGNDGYSNAMKWPACLGSTVAVAATATVDDSLYENNNVSDQLNFFAPGEFVDGADAFSNEFFTLETGTSMAAPHVSGAFAILKQQDPGALLVELWTRLADNGVDVVDAGIIRPRIDVMSAIRSTLDVPDSIQITYESAVHVIQVSTVSDTTKWKSYSSDSWIHIQFGEEDGSGALTIEVSENDSGQSRYGMIYVLGHEIEIVQSSPDPSPGDSPSVTTRSAIDVTQTSARLRGRVNPNGLSTNAWFQWGASTSYGNTTSSQNLGSGNSDVDYNSQVSGLSCGTTYYFQARAENSEGPANGQQQQFTTESCSSPPGAPSKPSQITYPEESASHDFTVGWSTVDDATLYELQFTTGAYPDGPFLEIYSGVSTSQELFLPNGGYRFRVRACKSGDCSDWQTGPVMTVAVLPTAKTDAADHVTEMSARLRSTVHPASQARFHFEYGLTTNYGITTSGDVLYDMEEVTYKETISDLHCATTYHFRVVASILESGEITYQPIVYGDDRSFTTDPCVCDYSISPTSVSVDAGGDEGAIEVTADSGCSWEASSNRTWISVTSGSSGSGSGTVDYEISSNASTSPRTGAITIADQTFAVEQSGLGEFTLTLEKSGSGTGTVTSTPEGIDCEPLCNQDSASFSVGEVVSLTASPASGSTFTGWDGDCSGTSSCEVTMTQASNVIANFNNTGQEVITVLMQGTGLGTVTSNPPGLHCVEDAGPSEGACQGYFDVGTTVTLTAIADEGSEFSEWTGISGLCSGVQPDCAIQVDSDVTLSAVSVFTEVQVNELTSGSPYTRLLPPGEANTMWHFYYIDVPDGVDSLEIELYDLIQPMSLYVKRASQPTMLDYDCHSISDDASRVPCMFNATSNPVLSQGRWYINVTNLEGYTGYYTVKATIAESPMFHDRFEGDGPSGSVRGIRFSGSVSGISGNGDWASDMRLDLSSPDSRNFSVGGIGAGAAETDWGFQGSVSNNDGEYTSQHPNAYPTGAQLDGNWTADLTHTWTSGTTMSWSEVSIALLNSNGSELGWLCIDSFDIAPGSPQTFQLQATECEFGSEDEIINVTFSPASPATLEPGDHILATVDYRIANPEGALIWAFGLVNGQITAPYQPSQVIPAGAGQLTRYFSMNSIGEILEVGVRMSNPDPQEILDEKTYNVEYVFEENTDGDNVVSDGSFEGGSPSAHWYEYSTNFDSPICSVSTCPTWFGPSSGSGWAWFGGHGAAIETGILSQDVVIPSGVSAQLQFQLAIPTTNGSGFLRVSLGEQEVFFVDESDGEAFPTYQLVTINMDAFANGNPQTLKFESVTQADGTVNFFLDDVRLMTNQ